MTSIVRAFFLIISYVKSGSSTKDICPKGWTLPEYDDLTYRLINYTGENLNLVTGGCYDSWGNIQRTNYGYWWDRTADNTNMRGWMWTGTSIGSSSTFRSNGYYVRCVKK